MITGTDRILTADTEAVDLLWGLTAGKESDIHIICCKDFETGERFTFFDDFKDRANAVWLDEYEEGFKTGNIRDGIRVLEECEVLIMHNVSGYDALALEKTHGSFDRDHFGSRQGLKYEKSMPYKTMDTAVMSRVLNPERPLPKEAYQYGHKLPGPHTIESHGLRMGRLKPEHEDWSRLTPEMIHRCTEDVEIGEDLFKYLINTDWKEHLARPSSMTGLDIRSAYYCELRMAFTMARQEQRGFAVDVKEMGRLVEEMDKKIVAVEKAFRPNMPRRIKKVKLSQDKIDGFVNSLAAATTTALSLQYEQDLERCDYRGSYATTYWKLVTQKGEYLKNVTKYIPKARGFAHEYIDPPVHGPFTPVVWEDIPLGNRDSVKQLLFKQGWLGVNYNDTELEYLEENGELPFPWSGKVDMDSMDLWEQSGKVIPDWCRGIGEWYIINSRRNQLLNAKDVAYFDQNGSWPRQTSGKNECRGLLANAISFDEDYWYMKTAQQFYEQQGFWPVAGHWRVPAKAFHDATNTHRMRQKLVVNIPARGLYGKQMRGVFIPGPKKKLLGCDGAGLELRMLAHFMNDPAYQEVILNGDIHTHNQNLAGLAERDYAKTFVYAFLYGSGIPNLARQLGLPVTVVEVAVNKFKRDLPLLTQLLERVQDVAEKFGYLLAVDGRWGRVRSKGGNVLLHTALNVLLQMTGSLVMKWAHVIAEDKSYQEGSIKSISDFPIVVHMHDECQAEVNEEEVLHTEYQIRKEDWKAEEKKQFVDCEGRIWSAPVVSEEYEDGVVLVKRMYHPIGDQYCRALKEAGEFLKLRCPTAGEYKIGDSWAATH